MFLWAALLSACEVSKVRSFALSRADPADSLLPRGSSAPCKGSPSQVPPWRERIPNFLAHLGPGWGCPSPGRGRPNNLRGRGVSRRRLRPLVGSPKEARFRRPGSAMEEGDAGAFPLPGRAPGREAASLSHPARPVGIPRPRGPGSLTVSAPLPCCPAPARPAAADTRGPAAPAPSGPGRTPACRLARLPGRSSAGRTRAEGSAGGKFPPRKEEIGRAHV